MFDGPVPAMQRTRGVADVVLERRDAATRLERLHQSGSAKAFLPRVDGPVPEVVFLNTAGGLTGGDRMQFGLALGEGSEATATTQTAERVYRAAEGEAKVTLRIGAGPGARLDWLPQETILFDGAALERDTEISLAKDARLLTVETLVLGRAAMGEEVRRVSVFDRRRILREGRPFVVEPVRLDPATIADRGAAGYSGARALSTLVLADQGAEDALGPVRGLLGDDGVPAHASAWDGRLVVRAMAADAWPLRRLIARVLSHLRGGPLPRVWQL